MQLEDVFVVIKLDSQRTLTGLSIVNHEDYYQTSDVKQSGFKVKNCIQCKACQNEIQLNLYLAEKQSGVLEIDIKQETPMVFSEEVITKNELNFEDKACSDLHKNKLPDEHLTLPKSEAISLTCKICSKVFKRKSGLKMHEKVCKLKVGEVCIPVSRIKDDDLIVEPLAALPENLKLENNVPQTWSCDVCEKKFKRRIDLKLHHKFCNSSKGPPCCDICGKFFRTWKSVRNHKRMKHEKEIRFTCEKCGFGSLRQETLNRHIYKTHFGNPRPFICDICDKRFPSKGSVSYHIQLKHLNLGNHICEMCSMKFIARSSLDAHILAKHTTEKKYPCPECPKLFKSAPHVKAHLYKVHVATELKPRFSCNQCEYVTHDKKSFNNHEILHRDDKEKPFQCKFCSKGFATMNNQLRHERTHTNERPFDCEVCGKGFRSKADLKDHTRYHTGEKPYECEICQQRYSDRGCYRAHLIVHEKQLGVTLDKSIKKFLEKPKKISSIPKI